MSSERLIEIQRRLDEVAETLGADDPLREYLKEIGRVEPLTDAEEDELAEVLAEGRKAELQMKSGEHTEGETGALQERVARREQAKRRLAEANLHLVVFAAKRHAACGVALIDLIQEGNLGLIKAVEKLAEREEKTEFKPNYRFWNYAVQWIRRSILQTIVESRRPLRIPVELVEEVQKVVRASRKLMQEIGYEPGPEEIAVELDMPVERVREILGIAREPAGGENLMPKEEPSAWERLEAAGMTKEDVEAELPNLPPLEKQVLRLRLGLEDGEEHSREELAELFAVPVARIRQMESKGLRKLIYKKQNRRQRPLRDYLE